MAGHVLELAINDKPVTLGQGYSVLSISTRYGEPRELMFSTHKDIRLALNAKVQLTVDGTVRFLGRVFALAPDPRLANQNVWTALDLSELAVDVQANREVPVGGILDPDEEAAAVQLAGFFTRLREDPLAEFLSLLDQAMGNDLRELGVCGDEIFSGVTSGRLARFSCPAGGFASVLNAALLGMPGYRWLWRPQSKTFHIANIYAAPEVTLELTRDTVESLPMTHDLRGRYSRVTLIGQWWQGYVPTAGALEPAWNQALEAQWTIDQFAKANVAAGQAAPMDQARADVFRKWSFAGYKNVVRNDFPITLYQFVPDSRFNLLDGTWVSIQIAEIDFANGFIWSRLPALKSPNEREWIKRSARIPGKSQRAVAMSMTFVQVGNFLPPSVSVGPSGDAYTLYGLDRELVLRDLDNSEVSTERATLIHQAVKDVAVSGSIPVLGPMPDALWDLGARINVTGQGVSTRLEAIKACVTGYTYTFAGGGRLDLEVGNDRTDYLGATMA